MEEEEFPNPNEESSRIRHSIERYEEMVRNKEAYFFDVDAFLNIIDYYIERNDPVKALQVVDFAQSQHPTSIDFLLRQAQLLAMVDRTEEALAILDKAEQLTPADPDLHMIRGASTLPCNSLKRQLPASTRPFRSPMNWIFFTSTLPTFTRAGAITTRPSNTCS